MALTDNLYAYYKLENANDSIGALNLTVNGATSGATGKILNCYDFNGTSNNLNRTGLAKAFTAISVSFWFNADTISGAGENRIFHMENISNQNIIYIETYLGKYYAICGLGGANGVLNPTTPTPPTATWKHYVITHTGSVMKMYVDGTEIATGGSAGFSVTADEIVIGGTTSSWWDGKIDELGVWDRAISAAEVTSLYNSGLGITYPFLPTTSGFFAFF